MSKRLIIVPCHSVWKPATLSNEVSSSTYGFGETADQWDLASFQYEGNDHLAFIVHALTGIIVLLKDIENNILVFSGSQTKAKLGPMSEAQSYYYLSYKIIKAYLEEKPMPQCFKKVLILDLLDEILLSISLQHRGFNLSSLFVPNLITTEEFALDSFDNLLYSIARYNETTSYYPDDITICGFGFKEERFLKYHANAIDFPIDRITYLSDGPYPNYDNKEEKDQYFNNLEKAENKNALSLFAKDWYGTCEPLNQKKSSRNLYKRTPRYKLLETMHLNGEQITDCQSHFDSYIKSQMPWSINKL